MKKLIALFIVAVLTASAGCPREGGFSLLRPGPIKPPTGPAEAAPNAQELVDYLNGISAAIPGIQSDDITLTAYPGGAIGIPIGGKIRAQGPRNFRLVADTPFSRDREVDMGSNDREFWYWIKRGDKYQVFCSYQAIEEGKVKHMPFPFQPDWVLEAMGMGRYGPAEKYEVAEDKDKTKLRLIERTTSPQGTPVKKIIVFNRSKAKNDATPQVTDFLLVDDKTNKVICSAHVTKRQLVKDKATGGQAYLPKEMRLEWPEQKMKLGLTLDGVQLTQQLHAQLFLRQRLQGVESFDLATMRVEGVNPAGGPPGIPR